MLKNSFIYKIKKKIKAVVYYLQSVIIAVFKYNSLKVYYFNKKLNFGDELNKYLVENLTGKKVININPYKYFNKNYFVIGSILQDTNSKSLVWGSGYIAEELVNKIKPKKVYAVRGPLSRKRLLEQGIDCPEVYGDPALLLPLIYKHKPLKKYKYGIIAHIVDKQNKFVQELHNHNDVLIIDIQTKNIESFVDKVCSCQYIFSSSLHGVILADAYNIPNLWVKFSDKLIGGSFKFKDYYMSVGKNITEPFVIEQSINFEEIILHINSKPITIDLKLLLNHAPFQLKTVN